MPRPIHPPLRRNGASRLIAALVLLSVCVTAQAQTVVVGLPGGGDAYLPLSAGGETALSFDVRHDGIEPAEGWVGGQLDVPAAGFAAYSMTPEDPQRCGPPTLTTIGTGTLIAFPLVSIPPGGTVTCRYTVRRAAGPTNDLGFRACWLGSSPRPFVCERRVRIGTLLDTALQIQPLQAAADGTTLVRLQVDHASPLPIQPRVVTTDCLEFEGGRFAQTAFDLDGEVSDGCPTAPLGLCANFTGMNVMNRAFLLGTLPSGESPGCLLRARPTGRRGIQRTTLRWSDDRVVLADGTIRFDPERGNDAVVVGLAPGPAVAVPLSGATPSIIALLLLGAGLLLPALARRSRSARVTGSSAGGATQRLPCLRRGVDRDR